MDEGEKVVCVWVDGHYIAVPLPTLSAGDKAVIVPLEYGNVALNPGVPGVGDHVVMVPNDMGQYIAITPTTGVPDWTTWAISSGVYGSYTGYFPTTESHEMVERVFISEGSMSSTSRPDMVIYYHYIRLDVPAGYIEIIPEQNPPEEYTANPYTRPLVEFEFTGDYLENDFAEHGGLYSTRFLWAKGGTTDLNDVRFQGPECSNSYFDGLPHVLTLYYQDPGPIYYWVNIRIAIDGVDVGGYCVNRYSDAEETIPNLITLPNLQVEWYHRLQNTSSTTYPWIIRTQLQVTNGSTESRYPAFNNNGE